MYGWMTRWLKDEGDGKPIAEPKHDIEKPEDLACLTDATRPKTFLFPPSFAAREAAVVLQKFKDRKHDHREDWESAAVHMRAQLRRDVFGDFPKPAKPDAKLGKTETAEEIKTTPVLLYPEPKLPLPVLVKSKGGADRAPACVLLDLEGKVEALKHPLAQALLDRGWTVAAPDLRGTGETKPAGDEIKGAPDHNCAEHALWIGRPLLGQWVFDVLHLIDWMALQPGLAKDHFAVAGIGQAGLVALCAAGLLDDRIASAAILDAPSTYVTDQPYPEGTRMGLLAPGILRVGDIPHLAALSAPRRLIVAGGVSAQGKKLTDKQLKDAFVFTTRIYKLHKEEAKWMVAAEMSVKDMAAGL